VLLLHAKSSPLALPPALVPFKVIRGAPAWPLPPWLVPSMTTVAVIAGSGEVRLMAWALPRAPTAKSIVTRPGVRFAVAMAARRVPGRCPRRR
jgi:hypothetical protein